MLGRSTTSLRSSTIALGLLAASAVLGGCTDERSAEPPSPICDPAADRAPADLACTGLYDDFGAKTLAKAARPFTPAAPLWSDGYEKSRYIALPDGAKIDATSMDEWTFPVGTKVWKEFRAGQRRIETRLLWKVRADHWEVASYVWSDDGTKASRGEGRSLLVDGKPYGVPTLSQCDDCHRGRRDKLLGFEALSLAQPAAVGVTLGVLASEGRLAPPPARTTVTLPHAALAILHVNCGVSCHNANPTARAFGSTLRLRLGFDEVATQPTSSWQMLSTSVGVPTDLPSWSGALRIAPGAPEKSAVVGSMKIRLTGQMPPLATTEVDVEGVGVVESWVRTLAGSK